MYSSRNATYRDPIGSLWTNGISRRAEYSSAFFFSQTMKFLVGTKQGMTQIFDAEGRVHPVTVIHAPKVTVTQVKTADKDGYTAVQVGYGVQKESRIAKP